MRDPATWYILSFNIETLLPNGFEFCLFIVYFRILLIKGHENRPPSCRIHSRITSFLINVIWKQQKQVHLSPTYVLPDNRSDIADHAQDSYPGQKSLDIGLGSSVALRPNPFWDYPFLPLEGNVSCGIANEWFGEGRVEEMRLGLALYWMHAVQNICHKVSNRCFPQLHWTSPAVRSACTCL